MGDRTVETDAYSIVIANGRFAGGGMPLAPQASPDDHRLDVLVVTAMDFLSRIRAASSYFMDSGSDVPGLIFHRSEHVHVTAEPAMRFSSDGELTGSTPATFRVLPEALRVVVPGEG